MPPQTPTGPDRVRLLAAAALSGWAAALLAEVATAAVDHAAGGTAQELRTGAVAGLALALVFPWARLLDRRHRLGPPRPVRGLLALGALAAAVPAAVLPLVAGALAGSAAGAGLLGALGAAVLATPLALCLGPGATGTALAAVVGAALAGLACPWSGSFTAACHAAAVALAAAAVLVLRSSANLRAVPVVRLPGTGSPWAGVLAATTLVALAAVLPSLGLAPFAAPRNAALAGVVLLGLASARPGSRPRGAALAAGLLLAHVLDLGGATAPRTLGALDGTQRSLQVLQQHGSHSVAWDRATQDVVVFDGPVPVDCHGPDHDHGALAALVAAHLAAPGAAVLVHECLQAAEVLRALGVANLGETVGDERRVQPTVRARVDGPVAIPGAVAADAPLPSVACLRRTLRDLPAGGLGVLVTGMPGARASLAADHGFHAEARRALGTGALLVPLPLDLVPPALVQATVAAARAVHPCVELLLVRRVLLLVATGAPVAWQQADGAQFAASRWWWAVGAADLADLGRARIALAPHRGFAPVPDALLLAAACRDGDPVAPRERMRATTAWLRAQARPGDELVEARLWLRDRAGDRDALAAEAALQLRAEREGSHLLHDELLQARLDAAVEVVRAADPADPAAVHGAAVAAAAWCHMGAPRAILQAALGLPNQSGSTVHDPAVAARLALALDPTLGAAAPPVLQGVFAALPDAGAAGATGALEDFARLPDAPRLAALCCGSTPLATALRARFGPACAGALLAVRRDRPWTLAELGALRELASIAVVDAAAALLAELGSAAEVLGAFRLDLPVSRGIERLLDAQPADRLALARALPRRKDPRAARALATLLLDDDLAVRAAAGTALERSWPGAVPYDPAWERSRLEEAARAVLALHNRRP